MCELCKQVVDETTFHHLIPVMLHNRNWYKNRYDFKISRLKSV